MKLWIDGVLICSAAATGGLGTSGYATGSDTVSYGQGSSVPGGESVVSFSGNLSSLRFWDDNSVRVNFGTSPQSFSQGLSCARGGSCLTHTPRVMYVQPSDITPPGDQRGLVFDFWLRSPAVEDKFLFRVGVGVDEFFGVRSFSDGSVILTGEFAEL